MFLCRVCHAPSEPTYGCTFDRHLSVSYGPCEGCGVRTECVDCREHHRRLESLIPRKP